MERDGAGAMGDSTHRRTAIYWFCDLMTLDLLCEFYLIWHATFVSILDAL